MPRADTNPWIASVRPKFLYKNDGFCSISNIHPLIKKKLLHMQNSVFFKNNPRVPFFNGVSWCHQYFIISQKKLYHFDILVAVGVKVQKRARKSSGRNGKFDTILKEKDTCGICYFNFGACLKADNQQCGAEDLKSLKQIRVELEKLRLLCERIIKREKLKENRIGASLATRWWRPCIRVAVYLSIDQGELLGEYRGVKAGGQKGRGSVDESGGAQLPKSNSVGYKGGGLRGAPQCRRRRIYRSRRKGRKCKATDSRAMGLAAPWYRRGGTSVETSIPCSYRGRALVVKGAEEAENAGANSKYQDRVEGQRPRNFIRPPNNFAFSTTKRMGEVDYPSSLTYPAEELCISSVTLRRKLMEDNMSFPLSEGSVKVNKDRHNSANPTPESVIGELKQHGGSKFDYSTTATESGWEPKGRVVAKAED
ncbi:hypothetical protein GW17_00018058 [Ensete ventricosum]|nr:hypothetical protein GW17_00018058 [Ensete ventricosum]